MGPVTDDLARWISEQLDEDERIARAAGGVGWLRAEHPGETVAIFDSRGEPVVYDEGWPTEGQQAHIAEWDPARVLREIDAKRQLLRLHGRAALRAGGGAQYFDTQTVCRSCEPNYQFPEQSWPCPTLRLLALPFEHRPGYAEAIASVR